MKVNWTLVWEAVKEPLREVLLAAIPGVLAYLGTLNVTWAGILYLVLRAVDSYLHELGKEKNDNSLVTGITRF
jgi:hypothetical protein